MPRSGQKKVQTDVIPEGSKAFERAQELASQALKLKDFMTDKFLDEAQKFKMPMHHIMRSFQRETRVVSFIAELLPMKASGDTTREHIDKLMAAAKAIHRICPLRNLAIEIERRFVNGFTIAEVESGNESAGELVFLSDDGGESEHDSVNASDNEGGTISDDADGDDTKDREIERVFKR